jgi:hypothetical protein
MGVSATKPVWGNEGPEEPKGEAAKGEEGKPESKEEPAAEEPKAEEPAAPFDEKAEMEKWKPFFKDVMKMAEVKDKIKTLILTAKAAKDKYVEKGILFSENEISDFVNGKNGYLGDIILFLGKGLPSDAPAEGEKKEEGAAPAEGAPEGVKKEEGAAPAEGAPAEGAPEGEKKEEDDKPKEEGADKKDDKKKKKGGDQSGGADEAAEGAPAESAPAEGAESEGLKGPSGPIKFDQAKAMAISVEKKSSGKPTRNLKPDTKFDAIDTDILLPLIEATKIAMKHKKYLKVLKEYVTDTKVFKAAHEAENIEGSEQAIKAGVKTKEQALKDTADKNKPPEEEGKEAAAAPAPDAKGGADSDNDSNYSGDDISANESIGGDNSSDNSSDDGSYGSNGSNGSNGSDSISGGMMGWRSDQEKLDMKLKKDYKKFKKASKADFKGKTEEFFNDISAVNKFMDDHDTEILELMYNGKIPGKWIDKSKDTATISKALVQAINAHGGAADAAGDAAPAPADGAAPAPAADAPAATGDAAAPAPAADAAPAAADTPAPAEGAKGGNCSDPILQSGGARRQQEQEQEEEQQPDLSPQLPRKTKQKKFTRKKPKNINIRINVGDNNAICDEESSSGDSDISEDNESSGESDTDDELEEKIIQKFAGHKNKRTRRKNLSDV